MRYTLAVTSCNRFDLLRQTLDSFINRADVLPEETVIWEDSDAPQPAWLNEPKYRALGRGKWRNNKQRRGQIFTLDNLYSEIETPYVFHLEDDWQFVRGGGFLKRSLEILQKHTDISTVSLRGNDCNGHPLVPDPTSRFLIQLPGWERGWGGYSFNPGLRRLSDLKHFGGSFGRVVGYGHRGCGHELALSKLMLDKGFRIAVLDAVPHIKHLGEGQSRAIEALPAPPRVLLAIPATHTYEYGTHTSGINRVTDGRVNAVRDTWLKDVAVFPNVDVRFFYGSPRPVWDSYPQDSIFLDVPDDYLHLPQKVQAVCSYALSHGYDYLIKTDDDTALHIDRLMRSGFDRVDQLGYYPCKHESKCSDYAVGMCYTLSRKALALVAAAKLPGPADSSVYWAEDFFVGRVLRNADIKPVGHPGWFPNIKGTHYVTPPFPRNTVAAHSLTPETMRAWYAAEFGA